MKHDFWSAIAFLVKEEMRTYNDRLFKEYYSKNICPFCHLPYDMEKEKEK